MLHAMLIQSAIHGWSSWDVPTTTTTTTTTYNPKTNMEMENQWTSTFLIPVDDTYRIHLQIWLFFPLNHLSFSWGLQVATPKQRVLPSPSRHFNWPCARNIASCAKGVVSSSKMRATARSSEPVDNKGAKQRSTWWGEVGHDGEGYI